MSDRDEERDAREKARPKDDKQRDASRGDEKRPPYAERWERQGKARFERDGRPGHGRDGDKARQAKSGERKPRFEGDRPPRDNGPLGRDLAAIRDVDEELLRLIMRRARLLQNIRSRGRISPETEKNLRLAWEQKASHLTRDSRLTRDMFALIQAVEPLSRVEEEQSFFNLAPSRAPVDLDLPAPGDALETRCRMALAAASGQALALSGVTLSDGVIDCLKSLNQLGGQLRWEEDGRVNAAPGKGLTPGLDKVVHVGDDAFSAWLIPALCLGLNSRLKITGGRNTRFLNLAPLRRFLPQMGARLTNVIPAQEGLPIRLECCGMLPDEIALPEDMAPDFAAALVLAAPFRDKDTRLRLPSGLNKDDPALLAALRVLAQCGIQARFQGDLLELPHAGLNLPSSQPAPAMDVPLGAALLLLPALSGGKAVLRGPWPRQGAQADLARELLESAHLSLLCEPDRVATFPGEPRLSSARLDPDFIRRLREKAPALWPLAALLAAAIARKGGRALLPTPASLSRNEAQTLEAFLAQLDLRQNDEGLLMTTLEPAPQAPDRGPSTPWLAPDANWAVALAWAALLKPNLRLVNPTVISAVWPRFWNLYNSLPQPELDRKHEEPVQEEKPAHRRIIASGAFVAPPNTLPAGGDEL